MTCIAIDPTCERCATRPGRRHCDGNCDDLCRMFARLIETPEGHEALHTAELCEECGHPRYDETGEPTEVKRPCRYGYCTEWHCSNCDKELLSAGPVMCKCRSTWQDRMWLRGYLLRRRIKKRLRG